MVRILRTNHDILRGSGASSRVISGSTMIASHTGALLSSRHQIPVASEENFIIEDPHLGVFVPYHSHQMLQLDPMLSVNDAGATCIDPRSVTRHHIDNTVPRILHPFSDEGFLPDVISCYHNCQQVCIKCGHSSPICQNITTEYLENSQSCVMQDPLQLSEILCNTNWLTKVAVSSKSKTSEIFLDCASGCTSNSRELVLTPCEECSAFQSCKHEQKGYGSDRESESSSSGETVLDQIAQQQRNVSDEVYIKPSLISRSASEQCHEKSLSIDWNRSYKVSASKISAPQDTERTAFEDELSTGSVLRHNTSRALRDSLACITPKSRLNDHSCSVDSSKVKQEQTNASRCNLAKKSTSEADACYEAAQTGETPRTWPSHTFDGTEELFSVSGRPMRKTAHQASYVVPAAIHVSRQSVKKINQSRSNQDSKLLEAASSKWSAEDYTQMASLRSQGLTWHSVSAALGRSVRACQLKYKQLQQGTNNTVKDKITDTRLMEVYGQHEKRLWDEMALELNCSSCIVADRVKKISKSLPA